MKTYVNILPAHAGVELPDGLNDFWMENQTMPVIGDEIVFRDLTYNLKVVRRGLHTTPATGFDNPIVDVWVERLKPTV